MHLRRDPADKSRIFIMIQKSKSNIYIYIYMCGFDSITIIQFSLSNTYFFSYFTWGINIRSFRPHGNTKCIIYHTYFIITSEFPAHMHIYFFWFWQTPACRFDRRFEFYYARICPSPTCDYLDNHLFHVWNAKKGIISNPRSSRWTINGGSL